MKHESWKSIPGWPGYRVSSFGRVKSRKRGLPRLMSLSPRSNGYLQVMLSKNGKTKNWLVHRLVYRAFHPKALRGLMVLHKDGDKTNNTLPNLYLGTAADNAEDAFNHGTLSMGNKHWKSKLNVDQVRAIRRNLLDGVSQAFLSGVYEVHRTTISKIATGVNWRRTA